MTTRSDWNSYKMQDGLNIWGAPTFQGIPVFAGGFELGDAVTDTLTLKGRVSTMSIAGSAIDIDSSYIYDELIGIQADVSDWTNIPGTTPKNFYGRYSRISTSVASAHNLYAEQVYAANGLPGEDGVNVALLQSFLFNTMGKGTSTIDLMRGGEIKCEWLATDTVTDAVGLVIEFMGLSAPTNVIYGLKFEKASAAGAMVPKFYEILMKEGMCILSGAGKPTMNAAIGSLYLRTDGSGTSGDTARAYIAKDAAGDWVAITTES